MSYNLDYRTIVELLTQLQEPYPSSLLFDITNTSWRLRVLFIERTVTTVTVLRPADSQNLSFGQSKFGTYIITLTTQESLGGCQWVLSRSC